MLNAVASADTVTWLIVFTKASIYATSLVAMGSVSSILLLRSLPEAEVRVLRRLVVFCAIVAAFFSVLRLPLGASFLTGGTWQGALDPMMLRILSESPLGFSIALRLAGLALVCAILLPARFGPWIASVGAILVATSFVFRGHALGEPRLLLAMLITLHLLGLSFWVGVFTPLYRLAARDTGRTIGPVSQEFGRKAIWVVGALTLAGGMTLWLLTGNLLTAVFTPYGQIFAIKLLAFLAIIGFAAWNNLSLTPALLRQEPKAAIHLRHSVSMEIAIVAMILLTTAVLTTISAPVSSV